MSYSRNQLNKKRKRLRNEEDHRLSLYIRKGKRVAGGKLEQLPAFHFAKNKKDINALERDPVKRVRRKGYKRNGKLTWRLVSTFETLRSKVDVDQWMEENKELMEDLAK